MHRVFTAAAAALLTLPLTAMAAVWTVDDAGTGDFLTIQEAIDAAASGDEIQVLPGLYVENIDYSGKDLRIRGLAGATETTIDGAEGPVGASSCVVVRNGETAAAVLEGFTLRGGTGTFFELYGVVVGGGVYCLTAGLTVRECHFEHNSGLAGAAIWARGATVNVLDSTFEHNIAVYYGSAISGEGVHLQVERCSFEGNTAYEADGAVSLADRCEVLFEDCNFVGNVARAGAGINLGQTCTGVIRRCIFDDNTSIGGNGGGIRIHEATALVEECLFVGNVAGGHGGGLIALDGSNTDIRACTFYQNRAGDLGGTLAFYSSGLCSVENSIVTGTLSNGGVWAAGGTPQMACCDVWGNGGGNFVSMDDPTGTDGNISSDPLFCGPSQGNFHINVLSPCADWQNPECGLIGAFGIGCGATDAPDHQGPTILTTTWGKVKATRFE